MCITALQVLFNAQNTFKAKFNKCGIFHGVAVENLINLDYTVMSVNLMKWIPIQVLQ